MIIKNKYLPEKFLTLWRRAIPFLPPREESDADISFVGGEEGVLYLCTIDVKNTM